jgi:hypothetical protein
LHEETSRRLGGAVKVVILDNLCEGVLKPDIYDPTLNPLYHDRMQPGCWRKEQQRERRREDFTNIRRGLTSWHCPGT